MGHGERIVEAVGSKHFRFTNEDELQRGIAQVLDGLGIPYAREFKLSKEDRIDFLVEGGLGIEIKIKGSFADLARQVHRYLGHEEVSEVLVVTSRAQLSYQLPKEMRGKTVTSVWLSTGAF